jgi:type II secretory pathway predicted ATPase ExeA
MNCYRYWNLKRSPFAGPVAASELYGGPPLDEALARSCYLVFQRRGLGVMEAPSGGGKSGLLRLTDYRCRLTQLPFSLMTTHLSAIALQAGDLPRLLASQLLDRPLSPRADVWSIWQRLHDTLHGRRGCGMHQLLLLDDIDQAAAAGLTDLVRLLDAGLPVTVLATRTVPYAPELPRQLQALVEMRVEIPAWDLRQTDAYLSQRLAWAGSRQEIFDFSAIARLHELSNGGIRSLNLLAEESLRLAAERRRTSISGDAVDQAAAQLPATPSPYQITQEYLV